MPIEEPEQRVRTRTIDWASEVRKAWGKDWNTPDIAYEFGNNRKFNDNPNGGPYTPPED